LKKPNFDDNPLFQQFACPLYLKRPVMTAEPSILMRKLKANDLFLVFASDGLWEHLTDEEVVQIVSTNPRTVSPHQTNKLQTQELDQKNIILKIKHLHT